ncbi:MAG: SDR family oxidoreductase [Novosphingobium sp.]|uniref:SDR family oxidoreductase n=1 Tax=Novosphingobium sp. TaxID=1874826 RepID=UPI003B9989AE
MSSSVARMIEPRDLQNVVITGAGSGIGRALARAFAAKGFTVAALGRTQAALEQTADGNPAIHPYTVDVCDAHQCLSVFARIAQDVGPVDVLVANAAIYDKVHFLDQTPESFSAMMRTNIEGVANSVRPVLPGMLERNCGRIIVMGSLADVNPFPGSMAYATTKGALHPLTRGIALEIDRDRYPNVLVNEFSPGATRTSMSDHGNAPEDIFPMLLRIVEFPSGGPHGKFFSEWRQVHVGESWKGALKRIILRKK